MRCITAPKGWSHIKNTVVLTILTFRHIQCLQLMYAEVAWVLISSETQVQPKVILDPDYLPDYLSVSLMTMIYTYIIIFNITILQTRVGPTPGPWKNKTMILWTTEKTGISNFVKIKTGMYNIHSVLSKLLENCLWVSLSISILISKPSKVRVSDKLAKQ